MSAWQIVLALAALYNLAIGGAGLVARGAALDARLVGLLVVCFGIVYAFVASDVERFAPVLWAGVGGKLGVIALMLPAIRKGEAPRGAALAIAGDAVFVVLFLTLLFAR